MRRHPHLLQINAAFFLSRLAEKYKSELTIGDIPDKEWAAIKKRGFDLVWLMGVWQRSPGSRAKAAVEPNLRRVYDETLPGWDERDVGGSPYAIHDYRLDTCLGKPRELEVVKKKLNKLGLGLILDFVPNHLAYDHPWTRKRPECFIRGTDKAAGEHPDWFFAPRKGQRLAHGRDPYFCAWCDTVQVDHFSEEARKALTGELHRAAACCDGLRCDMAMLLLNEVFKRVWGPHRERPRKTKNEFWPGAIREVRKRRPDFIFLAEVYWNLDKKLLDMGFDYAYDKDFYDTLLHGGPGDAKNSLARDPGELERMARFLENHDEDRAVKVFGSAKSRAAAAVIATLPGLRFFQDGQMQGRKVRTPIHLLREKPYHANRQVSDYFDRLLKFADAPALHDGEWHSVETFAAWESDTGFENFLAWSWNLGEERKLVVINYSPDKSQCRLRLPHDSFSGGSVRLEDALTGHTYDRDAGSLINEGLFIELSAWTAHCFNILPN